MRSKKIPNAGILISGLCLVLLPIVMSELFIRNLGWLIGVFIKTDEGDRIDYSRIFEQLRDAELHFPLFIAVIIGAVFCLACLVLFGKIKSNGMRITFEIFLFLLLFVACFVFSVLFCEVNSIRFCDLLTELLPIIDKL